MRKALAVAGLSLLAGCLWAMPAGARYRWSATPNTLPAVAARRGPRSRVSVYASWNGATTVARWQVLAGPANGPLIPIGSAASDGFETRIPATSSASTFAVRALDADGHVLATSARVHPS